MLAIPKVVEEIIQNPISLTDIKLLEFMCISAGDGPYQGQVGTVNRSDDKF